MKYVFTSYYEFAAKRACKSPIPHPPRSLFTNAAIASVLLFSFSAPAMADDCRDNLDLVTSAQLGAGLSARDTAKIELAKEAAHARYSIGDTDGCVAELIDAKIMLNLI